MPISRAQHLLERRRLPVADDQERRALRRPDLPVERRRLGRPEGEHEQMEDQPPERPRQLDDPRIEQELAQIAPQRRRIRRVGRPQVGQEDAHRRHLPVLEFGLAEVLHPGESTWGVPDRESFDDGHDVAEEFVERRRPSSPATGQTKPPTRVDPRSPRSYAPRSFAQSATPWLLGWTPDLRGASDHSPRPRRPRSDSAEARNQPSNSRFASTTLIGRSGRTFLARLRSSGPRVAGQSSSLSRTTKMAPLLPALRAASSTERSSSPGFTSFVRGTRSG